jgi:hypothetical protein
MSCVLVLLMAIGMMLVVVDLSPVGCLYPSFYIHMGRGYKEGNQVSYNMIPIRTLSLLAYFTVITVIWLNQKVGHEQDGPKR